MTYYINELQLTNTKVSKRTSSEVWSFDSGSAYNYPYIERTGQQATKWSINLMFDGSGRYNMVQSIQAEINEKDVIYFRSTTDNLFGNQTYVWLSHTDLQIDEAAGPIIKAVLSGNIDPYILHPCETTTDWSGVSLTSTVDGIKGEYAITDTFSSVSVNTTYQTSFTPSTYPSIPDISKKSYLKFYCKLSESSPTFENIFVQFKTDNSNYFQYNLFDAGEEILTANEWSRRQIPIINDIAYITGSPNTSSINSIVFGIKTDDFLQKAEESSDMFNTTGTNLNFGYTTYLAQMWSCNHDFSLSTVQMKLFRTGTENGDLFIELKEAYNGDVTIGSELSTLPKPFGAALATVSVTASSLPTSKQWGVYTFDASYEIIANKNYMFVLYTTTADGSNYVTVEGHTTQVRRPNWYIKSVDNGNTWTQQTSTPGIKFKAGSGTFTGFSFIIDDLRLL